MFETNNTPDHETDILQIGLVVSDVEAEAVNVSFDEALEADHDGSEPPPLIESSSTESTSLRNAVAD